MLVVRPLMAVNQRASSYDENSTCISCETQQADYLYQVNPAGSQTKQISRAGQGRVFAGQGAELKWCHYGLNVQTAVGWRLYHYECTTSAAGQRNERTQHAAPQHENTAVAQHHPLRSNNTRSSTTRMRSGLPVERHTLHSTHRHCYTLYTHTLHRPTRHKQRHTLLLLFRLASDPDFPSCSAVLLALLLYVLVPSLNHRLQPLSLQFRVSPPLSYNLVGCAPFVVSRSLSVHCVRWLPVARRCWVLGLLSAVVMIH